MNGSNISREIGKLANIFGRSMGSVSINKLFSSYFEADFSGSGKPEQITYLLNKYKDNTKELQYIVQEIINNHSSVTAKNIEPINNSLSLSQYPAALLRLGTKHWEKCNLRRLIRAMPRSSAAVGRFTIFKFKG